MTTAKNAVFLFLFFLGGGGVILFFSGAELTFSGGKNKVGGWGGSTWGTGDWCRGGTPPIPPVGKTLNTVL